MAKNTKISYKSKKSPKTKSGNIFCTLSELRPLYPFRRAPSRTSVDCEGWNWKMIHLINPLR
jgi:hypothetical protein